jgi:hypothetical protein
MEPLMSNHSSMRHQNPDLDFDDTRLILQGASYTIAAAMQQTAGTGGIRYNLFEIYDLEKRGARARRLAE